MMYSYLSGISLAASSQIHDKSDEYLHAALSNSSNALKTPSRASKAGFLNSSVGLAILILIRALQDPRPEPQSGRKSQTQKIIADAWSTSATVISSAFQLAVASPRSTSDDGCEVLFGRAGILYALLRLRSALDQKLLAASASANQSVVDVLRPIVADSVLAKLVDVIIQRGKNGSATYANEMASVSGSASSPALMWSWSEKRYLGGAHGVGMSPAP
jgi:hypothetical protein